MTKSKVLQIILQDMIDLNCSSKNKMFIICKKLMYKINMKIYQF